MREREREIMVGDGIVPVPPPVMTATRPFVLKREGAEMLGFIFFC